MVKNPPANVGWIPGLGRSPRIGTGNPLRHSCLGNPLDRGTWRATVHGAAESDTTETVTEHAQPRVLMKTRLPPPTLLRTGRQSNHR